MQNENSEHLVLNTSVLEYKAFNPLSFVSGNVKLFLFFYMILLNEEKLKLKMSRVLLFMVLLYNVSFVEENAVTKNTQFQFDILFIYYIICS